MRKNHSPQEVANSIKEAIKQVYGNLSSYANEKNITPTQIYSLLNGNEYISIFSAVRFCNDLDISIDYCTKGILPVFNQEHNYNKLANVAKEFFYAVKEEDEFREEFDNRFESLAPDEKNELKKILNGLRIKKVKAGYSLVNLLNIDWAEEVIDNKNIKPIKPIKSMNIMTLHEAIEEVIRNSDQPLTFAQVANLINDRELYIRKDGMPVPTSQISARVKNYPHLFVVNRETSPMTITLKN